MPSIEAAEDALFYAIQRLVKAQHDLGNLRVFLEKAGEEHAKKGMELMLRHSADMSGAVDEVALAWDTFDQSKRDEKEARTKLTSLLVGGIP